MKKFVILTAFLLSQTALAETVTYDVEGMHCGSCAKSISTHVCKMDGVDKCEVTKGKVILSTKAGITLSQEKVQSEISKAGEYKITGSQTSK